MTNKSNCSNCQSANISGAQFCANCCLPLQLELGNGIDEKALFAFRIAGYCAPHTPIPKGIFGLALSGEEGASRRDGELDQVLARLEVLGLARMVHDGVCFDQAAVALARRRDGKAAEVALDVLANTLAGLAFEAVLSGIPKGCMLFRPHLRVVAVWAEQAGLEKAVNLWSCLGNCQFLSKEYRDAKVSFGRALKLSEKSLGIDHARTAICMCNLAKAYRALDDETRAKKLDEQALQILISSKVMDDPHTASALNDLGSILHKQGDLEEARKYFEKAVAIYQLNGVMNNPGLANASFNLGTLLEDVGDLDGALAQYERAYQIDEPLFGPEHPKVVAVAKRISDLSKKRGDD